MPQQDLLESVVGLCDGCDMVWIVGAFLDVRHAIVAASLPWLCPDCYRPLLLRSQKRQDVPTQDAQPC
jgi:hypothetical protein